MTPRPRRASEILSRLADEPGERLTVETIFAALGQRSFSLLIVLLGLPNCIPMPPPIPIVCGFILVFVALQILFGRRSPWMPAYVLRQSVAKGDVVRAIGKALPIVTRLEAWSRPRLVIGSPALATVLTGLLVLVLAIGVVTAAPFLGQIPFGIAVCLVGLGLIERDGALIIAGMIFAAIGFFISAGFVFAIVSAIGGMFR